MSMILERELQTYRRLQPELLLRGPGKVVLIHGTTVHGLFSTEDEALAAAYAMFGLDEAFFIRRVEETEPVAYYGVHSNLM